MEESIDALVEFVETMQDDELQTAVIQTLQSGLVKTSQHPGFHDTVVDVDKCNSI